LWLGCSIYDCNTKEFNFIGGCDTNGTNNFAELYPTVKTLWVHRNRYPNEYNHKILVISDSEWTVKTGLSLKNPNDENVYQINTNNPNAMLWESIKFTMKFWGYDINFKHVPRNSNDCNTFCDEVAGHFRKSLIKEVEECRTKFKMLMDKQNLQELKLL
jgi:hypothetical protein